MGDILKEAIADAKAVRETALQNAKIALEEAFTPQLKSMLSAKLKEDEFGDEEESEEDEEEFAGDEEGDEEVPAEEGTYEDEEFGDEEELGDEEGGEEDFGGDEGGEEDFGDEGGEEDEEDVDEGIIEINGVKYAPVVSEEEEEEVPADDDEEVEEEGISGLDLESVIKELEDELSEGEDDEDTVDEASSDDEDTVDESSDDSEETVDEDKETEYEIDESLFNEEDEEDTVDEQSSSSNIGSGDNALKAASSSDEEDPDGQGVKKQEFKEVYDELGQYKEAVVFLKDKLHEVNILNAKLLFTNKLFKEFILDNDQKLKIVENFDRAQTVREIKLVYSTIAEQLQENSNVSKKNIVKESVGGSSKTSGSTKPKSKKIITEENKVADRFKRLAGLIK